MLGKSCVNHGKIQVKPVSHMFNRHIYNPHQAGSLIPNTPYFMVLLIINIFYNK